MTRSLSHRTIALHWIIAILVIVLWVMGKIMHELPREAMEQKRSMAMMHGSFGLVVFGLGIWRLIHRLREGFPAPLSQQAHSLDLIAKIVHWVLLLVPILLPISGIMLAASTGQPFVFFGMELYGGSGERNRALHEIGEGLHEFGGTLVLIAVVLHVVGAIKHQYIDKDGTISRMLGKQ